MQGDDTGGSLSSPLFEAALAGLILWTTIASTACLVLLFVAGRETEDVAARLDRLEVQHVEMRESLDSIEDW